MTLTIFYNNSKCKQIVNLSRMFFFDEYGQRIAYGRIVQACKDIAHDITQGNYLTYHLDLPYEIREEEEVNSSNN